MRTEAVSTSTSGQQPDNLLELVFARLGDLLADLAARYGVSEPALRQANPGIGERLGPGDAVRLPPGEAEPSVKAEPPAVHTLGDLSSRYETGGRGPGTVSGGQGDAGGVSYGSYQLASRRGRPAEFLANEGAPWAERFAGQTPGSAAFSATWRAIAREQPQAFHAAQHDYIQRTHYAPLAEGVQRRTGLDADTHSAALRDVLWSTAVQHGPGSRIIDTAIGQVDARMERSDPGYDRALIQAIYAERGRRDADGQLHHFRSNSAAVQAGVAQRFIDEQADALRMLTP